MADRYDQLADELVGGAQEEFVAELTERMATQLEADVSNADVYRVSVAAARAEAMGVWAKFKGKVSAKAAAAFTEALSDVDEEAVAALQAGHGDALKGLSAEGVKNAIAVASDQVARLISMQNTALANTAADAYYATVADAVTRLQMGEGRNAVMERAYAKLADAGIETVDYKSGCKTLIDAAVRRHVVTQQSQCRASLLDARMDEWGHDLVYVSAHYGARPSHSAWQGKVYSRSGKDKRYASLSAATGYGTAGGLCGCNCRHTYSPYVEGVSQLPSTDWSAQEKLTGMTSDAYYAATQRQRAYERQIRKVKREIATGQAHGQDMASERAYLGALQAKQRAHVKANHLTRDYAREKAYGVKQQPTALPAITRAKGQQGKHFANSKGVKSAGANSPIGIDATAQVYSGLRRSVCKILDEALNTGDGSVVRMYKRFETTFQKVLRSPRGSEVCKYNRYDNQVTLDLRYVFQKGYEDTWFHEFGHNIDCLASSASARYASHRWRGGAFAASLKVEAEAHIERAGDEARAEMLTAFRKSRSIMDVWPGLATDQQADDYTKAQQAITRKYSGAGGGAARAEEAEVAALADEFSRVLAAQKASRAKACERLSKELKGVPDAYSMADVSDIMDGATEGEAHGGWEHGTAYWKASSDRLAAEAFAEMTSAHICKRTGSLSRIEQYFPESVKLYRELVSDILGGAKI